MRQKTHPVLTKCPVCQENLIATKMECEHCESKIEGRFHFSKFNYLEPEKLYFIELFVKSRGNIKAIEKELNMSYPTVKKMLDDVISELGYPVEEEEENDNHDESMLSRAEIIKQLENKEITVLEALNLLKKGK
ncbi:MAG: DUF2089 domain-containing protein [Acholeplasmataceae bacterium]